MTAPRPEDARLRRDEPVVPRRTALLLVDVQNDTLNESVATSHPYFYQRCESVVLPNVG